MPGIYIKPYYFKPSLIPSLVTIALLYLMISLGIWQLDRAEYKASLQTIIESRQNLDAISLSSIGQREIDWLYQPVFTAGRYDAEHQVYLDNQVHNMVVGYSVFTPLKLTNDLAILVNRGWVPQGKTREQLPEINMSTVLIQNLSGLLASPPSKGLVLSSMANNYASWPVVLQYVDTNELEAQLGYKLMPMVMIINDTKHTSFDIMPIKVNMRSEKHTAYAFQWFALSLALFIIYIVVNSKRKN